MCLNVHFCVKKNKIWIPEIEYYQKVSSHAQIWPQGAEKQLIKVNVGGGGGCRGQTPTLLYALASDVSWSFARACQYLYYIFITLESDVTEWDVLL